MIQKEEKNPEKHREKAVINAKTRKTRKPSVLSSIYRLSGSQWDYYYFKMGNRNLQNKILFVTLCFTQSKTLYKTTTREPGFNNLCKIHRN